MAVIHSRKTVGDFAIHTLANDALSLSFAPELGGRLVSLIDRASGREWLDGWSPAGKRRIWHPSDPTNYDTGPGAGLDECLPTVLPCKVGRRFLPDHGELWNRAPEFDLALVEKGVFLCRWKLKSLPLAFERRISIRGNTIRFDYRLENLAEKPTPFLWAWHPLFTWKPGDQIHFARSVKTCLTEYGEPLQWPEAAPGADLSRASFPKGATPAAKVFITPKSRGIAEIRAKSGANLKLTWPTALLPHAGVWITRGFWRGLHHWAIEPTNAPVDRLSDIRNHSSLSRLDPRETRNWTLTITLGEAG